MSESEDTDAVPGLRERKKARTRAAIQGHALRLFRAQGYDATPMSQIAADAEVSESTLYRYFPTKEELVLWDALDPLLIEAFKAQPPELPPLASLRAAFRAVFDQLAPEEWAEQEDRINLILGVPELRAAMVDQFAGNLRQIADIVGQRVGRRPDDVEVRNMAGAVLGVSIATMFAAADDPTLSWPQLLDEALAHLESGLPL